MPIISADELDLLRTFSPGIRADTFASFLKPLTLWTAQVNDAGITRGDTTIAFNTGAGSHFAAIEKYQEVWVGTSAGANDKGRLRIRAISSGDGGVTGTLTVAHNNTLWVNSLHITFIHNYIFDAMFPYVSPAEIFYKDRDITYVDQNEKPPPIANIQIWPRAQRLINGEATFWLNASDSYAIADGKTITSYALTCYPMTDTTVTFNTSTGVGRIDITGSDPDYRWLKLIVTDSNAVSQVTYRCIFVHGETSEDTNYPHTDFEIGNLSGSWEGGGWKLDIKATDNASLADIPDMTFAVAWQDRYIGVYSNDKVRVNNYLFVNPKITYRVETGSPCTILATFHAGVMKDGVPSNGDSVSIDIMAGGTGWINGSNTTSNGELTITGYSIPTANCNGTLIARENGTSTTVVSKSYIKGQIVTESSYYPAPFIVFPQELIVGYVGNEKLDFDNAVGSGADSLSIITVEGLLKNGYMFSIELDSRPTISYWHEYPNWLTIGRACHHIWRWHSTLIHIANVYGLVDNTDKRSSALFENGNLYTMPDIMARQHGIRAHVVCNKKGDLWLTQDTQLLLDADRAGLDTVAVITKDDRSGDFGINRSPEPNTALVYGSGLYFLGTYTVDSNTESDTYSLLMPDVEPYCSLAPGTVPTQRGERVVQFEKQVLTSQVQLNELTGRVLAQANNLYPEARCTFHMGYLYFLDIHWTEFWEVDIATSDTIKELAIPDLNLIAREINVKVETNQGFASVEVTFEPEADGFPGLYSECPGPPSDLGGSPPVIEVNNGGGAIVTASSVDYLPPGSSTWVQRTAEATSFLIADPFWRIKTSPVSAEAILIRGGVGYLKWSDDAGVTWSTITPSSDPPNDSGDSPAPTKTTITYVAGAGSHRWEDEFSILANWQNAGGAWRSWLWVTDDNFTSGTWKSLGGTPTLACQELSGIPVELDNGTITDIRGATWSLVNDTRQICEIDTDKYVVGYINNSSPYDIYVQVVNVGTGTPVLGVKKLTDLGGQTTAYGFTLCKVDTNKFAILDNYYANPQIQICVVSGSTITTGTATNWISAREISELVGASNIGSAQSNTAYAPTVCAPDASTLHIGRVGILVKDTGGATCTRNTGFDGFHFCKGTISSTTFTPDTIVCKAENINDWDTTLDGLPPRYTDHIRMSSSMSLAAYGYMGVGEVYSRLVAYDSSTGIGSTVQFASGGSPTNFRLVRLSDTKAILFFAEENFPDSKLFARVVTVSGTTITLGTNQLIYTYSGVSTYNLRTTEISSTEAAVIFVDNTGCKHMAKVTANTITNLITAYDTCAYGWPAAPTTYDVHGIDADDFLLLRDAATISGVPYDPSVTIGNYATVLACAPGYSGSFRSLGIAHGHYAGNKIWITGDDSTKLEILEVDITVPSVTARTSLGSATHAQVDARTYYAIPATYWGSDDYVVVGGRFTNPTTANLVQLAFTGDGAATFFDQELSWGNDYCGALLTWPSDILFAVRNTGSRSKLYGATALTTPILLSTSNLLGGVNHTAMDLSSQNYAIVAAADVGGTIMVSVCPPPYQVWYDITSNHQIINGVNSLVIL